ncbi:hypothetical protein D5086_014334 [Populus alba]|uniref:Uncharacterized protein n=1 Tax=Populus alba TaxID=43335 RepID=A0ACC4BX63_POPAL
MQDLCKTPRTTSMCKYKAIVTDSSLAAPSGGGSFSRKLESFLYLGSHSDIFFRCYHQQRNQCLPLDMNSMIKHKTERSV